MIVVLCMLLGGLSPLFGQETDFPSHWEGGIEVPGSTLEFDVDLVRDGDSWTGDITIPAQGARDLPLEGISIDGDQVRFTITGVPGEPTFDGERDGETIAGDFVQGGQTMSFSMSSGERLAEKVTERLEGVDAEIEAMLEEFAVPGVAVSVVADGEVVLERGYGVRDVESGQPVDADTLFAIGSTSKAFTAFVLGTLVDEGVLEWDEPVITYLPDFRLHDPHATQRLKVRDLLIHSSGLPRHDLVWYGSTATRQQLFERLRHLEPTRDLGEEWQYQNLMYMTAGYLAERVTGETWEELVRQRIFEPLGIERANFSVEDSKADPNAASPHEVDDRQAEVVPYRNIDAIGPAGSINASASTASKWMQMLLSGGEHDGEKLIEQPTLREMVTPHMSISAYPTDQNSMMLGYGLGWMLEAHRGKFVAHHGGGIDGFISWIALLPRENVGVAVYTNAAGKNPLATVIGRTLIDRALALDAENPVDYAEKAKQQLEEIAEAESKAEASEKARRVEGTAPSHALGDYVGEYLHPGYGSVAVRESGDGLEVEFNGMRAGLEHWHYDTFNAVAREESEEALEDSKLLFRTDVDGRIHALAITLEPASDPIVFERAPDERLTDADYLERFVGRYQLEGQIAAVTLSGSTLKVSLPGQPTYTLEPKEGSEFGLQGLSGFSLEFLFEDDGETVRGARFLQPNGIFEATRMEE